MPKKRSKKWKQIACNAKNDECICMHTIWRLHAYDMAWVAQVHACNVIVHNMMTICVSSVDSFAFHFIWVWWHLLTDCHACLCTRCVPQAGRQAPRKREAVHKSGCATIACVLLFAQLFPNPKTEVVKYEFQYYHIINYLSGALFRVCLCVCACITGAEWRCHRCCHAVAASLVSFVAFPPASFRWIPSEHFQSPAIFPTAINYIRLRARKRNGWCSNEKCIFLPKSIYRLWACSLSSQPLRDFSHRRQLRIRLNSIKASFMGAFGAAVCGCVCIVRQSRPRQSATDRIKNHHGQPVYPSDSFDSASRAGENVRGTKCAGNSHLSNVQNKLNSVVVEPLFWPAGTFRRRTYTHTNALNSAERVWPSGLWYVHTSTVSMYSLQPAYIVTQHCVCTIAACCTRRMILFGEHVVHTHIL